MSTYSADVLASSPAIYYRLGEPSGTSAADSSGNARNGTYTNTPTLGVTGIPSESDTAVTFASASSQYVAPSFTFNQANATVEAWINISSLPGAGQLIAGCDDGGGTNDKQLFIHSDGKLYFYAFDGGAKATGAPASTIPTGQWVHVAGVADGSSLFTYVNGVQAGTVAAGATYTAYGSNNFQVAKASSGVISGFGTPGYFDGSIDEVAIYPTGLSAATLLDHYTVGSTVAQQFIHTFNAIPFMSGH